MSDGEILVRVSGVSKKFCRSLKRSLWYGVCDMARELNPFGRGDSPLHLDRGETDATLAHPMGEGLGMRASSEVSNPNEGGARHSVRAEDGGPGTARPAGLRRDEFYAAIGGGPGFPDPPANLISHRYAPRLMLHP